MQYDSTLSQKAHLIIVLFFFKNHLLLWFQCTSQFLHCEAYKGQAPEYTYVLHEKCTLVPELYLP